MISELQRLNSGVEHVFKKLRGCFSAFPPQNNAEIENWGVAFRMTVKLFFRPCSDDHRATGTSYSCPLSTLRPQLLHAML
jgi:hypothetical protein